MKSNGKRKQIAVIGLGQFGGQIARDLAKHAEVLAIDRDKERVDVIAEQVQRALCLDASDLASLKAVISPAFDEVIVSMGETMEASILCTLHLRQIGVKSIRAKAISDDHAVILTSVGANRVVFPERETASRMALHIINPNLLDFIPIEQDYRVMDLAAPESFHGETLVKLHLRKHLGVFIIAIKQPDKQAFVFLPGPDYAIRPEDVLVMIGKEDDLLRVGKEESTPA
ncbi:MAG: TrkA family potassium uptake protein [Myxococcales bacterium]|nr:MAG: TrkA family potassium uptake protein [Myxococcales bacterium]